jgi:hypothetical protein
LIQLFDDWMMHGDKSFTKDGNPRPPAIEVYLDWVVTAWNSISTDVIVDSFKSW